MEFGKAVPLHVPNDIALPARGWVLPMSLKRGYACGKAHGTESVA